ncbi:MAG: RdgB/HAM1 family non-canonical purine NTP pyrophosphatase [Chloroflexi bacterium]|nr:RdgB/HAM1 family non-canonical purine NTP pyrophosphatase [Chloroflexota bacterium]
MARSADSPRKLLIATNNKGKLQEYRHLLLGLPCELVSLAGEGIKEASNEEGQTFEENAALKAREYASRSGCLMLADDSGLEVDALGGRPGVHSARYGGETTDEGRIGLLLRELNRLPQEQRTARFVCVIAIDYGGPDVASFRGECGGVILFEPRGKHGFGYDPVFYLPQLGKSMAELSFEEKNEVSHRANAARQARGFLLKVLKGATVERPV